MTEHLSMAIAFSAGLFSFLSPCVLPLIPSYLCIIGGAPMNSAAGANGEIKPRLVVRTVSFIFGFSMVFVVLSILFSVVFSLLSGISRWINWISGAVVVVLGLNIIFDFLAFLNYEKRFHLTNMPKGIGGAFLAGAAFGAGWTPCVGPVLGSILVLAAQNGGVFRSALYLICYSAGLGIPFLLAAIFFNEFVKKSAKLRGYLPVIRRISGILLVAIGVLIISGRYQALNALTAKWQSGLLNKGRNATSTVKDDSAADDWDMVEIGGRASKDDSMADNIVSEKVIGAFNAAGLPAANKGFDPVDFNLPLLSGGNQRLSDLKGKVVLLNFWATWCGPCRMEMPSMEAVYQRLKDRGFTILAVNLAEKKQQVAGFINQGNFTFPVILDEKGLTGVNYNVQAIPTTYILDRRGYIISRVMGSIDWNNRDILAAIETLMNN
jgi:cytochrome c-type biogenesis protein